MLHLIAVAVLGLVVGALAKLIMPGKDPGASSSRCCWVSQVPFWGPSSVVPSVIMEPTNQPASSCR